MSHDPNIAKTKGPARCDACQEIEGKVSRFDARLSGKDVVVRLCQDCTVKLFLATEGK